MQRIHQLAQLQAWKASTDRKPLVIFGARHIGKTHSVLQFGKQAYENVVYCNFEGETALAELFRDGASPESIVASLRLLKNTYIEEERTLIVFDEIQACEPALAFLREFSTQGNGYHIIATASLPNMALGSSGKTIAAGTDEILHFYPMAHKVNVMQFFPMGFDEFLLACGEDELLKSIAEHAVAASPLENAQHRRAVELYRTFLAVGGYPQVVSTYRETGDFNLVRAAQNDIANAYIADIARYASPAETARSMAVYNSIIPQLEKKNTKFQYSVIKAGGRAKEYEVSLAWLERAAAVLPCTLITEGKYPADIYESPESFKLYYSDVGLLSMRMSANPDAIIHGTMLPGKTEAMLAENYVAQELSGMGKKPFYWTSGNVAELDFVFPDEHAQSIIPIETKDAENSKAKSLREYIRAYAPAYAIRSSCQNFSPEEQGVRTIPLYALFTLREASQGKEG